MNILLAYVIAIPIAAICIIFTVASVAFFETICPSSKHPVLFFISMLLSCSLIAIGTILLANEVGI